MTTTLQSILSDVVRQDRRTVAQIAKALHVAPVTLHTWLNGTRTPQRDKLNKIIDEWRLDPAKVYAAYSKCEYPVDKNLT